MRLIKSAVSRFKWLYGLYIRRDPFLIEVQRWFRDQGDQTLRLDYPLNADSVVVDVGGYRGDFAQAVYEKFGCRLFVFEPVLKYYEMCVKRFSGNSRIKVFPYGLGGSDAVLPLEVKGDGSRFCSVQAPLPGTPVAEMKRVDAAFQQIGIDQIDLIKINIEGGEYELLDVLLATGWLEKIRFVQIQFHNFVPDATRRRQELRERLSATHEEMWNYEFVWESWKAKSWRTFSGLKK